MFPAKGKQIEPEIAISRFLLLDLCGIITKIA